MQHKSRFGSGCIFIVLERTASLTEALALEQKWIAYYHFQEQPLENSVLPRPAGSTEFRDLIIKLGLDKKKLAREVSVSVRTVEGWLQNRRPSAAARGSLRKLLKSAA